MLWKQSDLNSEKQDSLNPDDINNEKSQHNDSDANEDSRQDIDFVYDDTDEYTAEIAELYSYTEEKEFFDNQNYFYESFRKIYGSNAKWIELSDSERRNHILRICDLLDCGQKDVRNKAARSLLYILQGVFGECELEEDQITWTRHNVFLCLECGVLSLIVDLLLYEIKYEEWQSNSGNGASESDINGRNNRKLPSSSSTSLGSNAELRVVLNQLYIVIETIRNYKCKHKSDGTTDTEGRSSGGTGGDKQKLNNWMKLADNLIEELNEGIASLGSVEEAPNLMIVLFGMVNRFCSGLAPNFPMKKVLLVLWKTSLLILGPVTNMFEAKNAKRAKMSMPLLTEDTNKIAKYMKATNFPMVLGNNTSNDLFDTSGHQPSIKSRPRNRLAVSQQQGPSQGSFANGRVNGKLMSLATNTTASTSISMNLPTNGKTGTGGSSSMMGANSEGYKSEAGEKSNDNEGDDSKSDDDSSISNTIKHDDGEDSDGDRTYMMDDDIEDEEEEVDDVEGNGAIRNAAEMDDENRNSIFDVDEDTIDDIHTQQPLDSLNLIKNNQSDSCNPASTNQNNLADGMATPRPSSPTNITLSDDDDKLNNGNHNDLIGGNLSIHLHDYKTLPWKPKVKSKDLENFMETVRAKFIGYPISGTDSVTLAGLPHSIQDAVQVLKSHIYVSIGEVQIKEENEIIQFPLSIGSKEVIEETPVEKLYKNMLPLIPQYMIALLKILLAAAPTSKSKTESINILTEVVPDEIPITVAESYKLNYDANRHKEIIVKAISGLLLLLLKHFKLNHIYQFEYVSQHLVFANCIPLVLKFFNQNILNYVQARNSISAIDFPSCVIGDKMELNAETLENNDQSSYCWRNVFSCINLLRILNMLTKWKHSRTMMMVVFKSPPILKRALKVRQAMLQLYILKLLKSQTRYSGRQWRKTNMSIMSAIYQKVRHRLTDDWAYGNDVDARPWDFQAEECSLRTSVNRFNSRRYMGESLDPEFVPSTDRDIMTALAPKKPIVIAPSTSTTNNTQKTSTDSSLGGGDNNKAVVVIGKDHVDGDDDLPLSFKENYEKWLEQEVYSVNIDWDRVLGHTRT